VNPGWLSHPLKLHHENYISVFHIKGTSQKIGHQITDRWADQSKQPVQLSVLNYGDMLAFSVTFPATLYFD
jgi:hypothetical protein